MTSARDRLTAAVARATHRWLCLTLLAGAACTEKKDDDGLTGLPTCQVYETGFDGMPTSLDEGEKASAIAWATGSAFCFNGSVQFDPTSFDPTIATVTLDPLVNYVRDAATGRFTRPVNIEARKTGLTSLTNPLSAGSSGFSSATAYRQYGLQVNRPLGDLDVTVSGLPPGVAADVKLVQGTTPVGTFPFSAVQRGLVVGDYTLNAAPVRTEGANSDSYLPSRPSQPVSIQRRTTTAVAVTYVRQAGTIDITISGLPAGVPANVQLFPGTAPIGNNPRLITTSTVLSGQSIGLYTIVSGTVVANGVTYIPTVTSQITTVVDATTSTVRVVYVAQLGNLAVSIVGIDGPADVDVLRGPTLVRNLTASATLTDLPLGGYTVNARSVDGPLYRYDPIPVSQSATVIVAPPALAVVSYTAVSGALNVTITGLPAGLDGRVLVNPAGNSSVTVAALARTTLVPRLSAGGYVVQANPVTSATGVVYLPTPVTTPATITNGRTTTVDVVYAPVVPPRVNFTLTGVPPAGATTLTITGGTLPSPVTVNVTGATTGTVQLPPGSYSVRGNDITVGNSTYQPVTRNQSFVVTGTDNQPVVYPYYLALSRYRLAATIGVLNDPFGHRDFVQMPASLTLDAVWSWASPTALPLITVTGPAPWITVAGTRNPDGSATLTGSGSAAGFSGVAARLTGTVSATSSLTGGVLQLGSPTPPTGLPNGPITYTIVGVGTPNP